MIQRVCSMPINITPKPSKPSLSFHLYPGLFGGHNAVTLKDGKGKTDYLSYHAITQDYLQKQKNNPDYVPPTERTFKEDDLPDVLLSFKRNQWDPMYNSKALVVTNPKTLSDTVPTPTVIPLTDEEYQKAKATMNKTQAAVKTGELGYSIWARQSGHTQLESCASVSQLFLDSIARKDEISTVQPSKIEQYTTPLPTRVHQRAEALSEKRTNPILSTTHAPDFFKPLVEDNPLSAERPSQATFNPFI